MKALRFALIGALFATLVVISSSVVLAQCPEDEPDCPLEPPQSEQIDSNPISIEDTTGEVNDPGAINPVEAEMDGQGPAIINPVPLTPKGATPPDFDKVQIPVRWQEPTDTSCGVQAIGMAFDGLGGSSPTSGAILEHLQSNNMMHDFGTGVEELAYTAQQYGYKGTVPFHDWSLNDLQGELAEGRTPVVAIGWNGAGQPGHFVTVTGISPDGKWISYNDPTLGEQIIRIEEFNRLWGLQGNSGVAVRKTVPPGGEDLIPWVAMVATLMAIISQTPLALRRMGIGGRLIAAGGGSTRRRSAGPRATQRPRRPIRKVEKPKFVRRFMPHSKPRIAKAQPIPPQDPRGDREKLSRGERIQFTRNPVLDPVPPFFSHMGGWIQANIINLGRKNKKIGEFLINNLGPAAETLRSYDDPVQHPIMSRIRDSSPEHAAAAMGFAIATPGIQDDVPLALWFGIPTVISLIVLEFGRKNTLIPRDYAKEKQLQRDLPRMSFQPRYQPPQVEPPDKDPYKGLRSVLGRLMASKYVPGWAKAVLIGGSLAYVFGQVSGENSKEGIESGLDSIETPSYGELPIPGPIHLPTTTPSPSPTPTSEPSVVPIQSPQPTNVDATKPNYKNWKEPEPE
jgi:hypothetical protein